MSYLDIREALKDQDTATIDKLVNGRDMRAVRVSRKNNGCTFHSGFLVSATQKGLTAHLMRELAEAIGSAGILYDQGGPIDRVVVDGLPDNVRIEWTPDTQTYAVYRDGRGEWLSVAGNVVSDGPFFF